MIVGIDEVGRGCWAGPVVAGAVVLDEPLRGIKDSKLLTRQQRQNWAVKIEAAASYIGLGWSQASEVDELGLTQAVRLAMERALAKLPASYESIIIDGNYNFLSHWPRSRAIIKADMTVQSVSAASIIAKVARDNYMFEMAAKYPSYGFEHNVGYGTKLHRERLGLHGISQLHRRSYAPIQSLLELSA